MRYICLNTGKNTWTKSNVYIQIDGEKELKFEFLKICNLSPKTYDNSYIILVAIILVVLYVCIFKINGSTDLEEINYVGN